MTLFDYFKGRPGFVYMAGEPEYIGAFPVKSEMVPIEPGPAKGWSILKFQNWSEIFLLDQDGRAIKAPVSQNLEVGTLIAAPTLVGWVQATVQQDPDGGLRWETEKFVGDLKREEGVWTTSFAINKKLLEPRDP